MVFELLNSNFQQQKSQCNIGNPDPSFCMHIDSYPDSKHKKFQTTDPTRNAFSVRLKLANNPKIHTSIRTELPASFVWESHKGRAPCHSKLLHPHCLCFPPVTLKSNLAALNQLLDNSANTVIYI